MKLLTEGSSCATKTRPKAIVFGHLGRWQENFSGQASHLIMLMALSSLIDGKI